MKKKHENYPLPEDFVTSYINRETLRIEHINDPSFRIENEEKEKMIHRAINTIGERNGVIIRLYFGLKGVLPRKNMKEIARILNMPYHLVRKRMDISIRKLRHPSRFIYLSAVTPEYIDYYLRKIDGEKKKSWGFKKMR